MFKVVTSMKKRPGLSREAFMDYYANRHIPFLQTIISPTAPRPLAYRRNFVRYGDPLMDVIGHGRGVRTESDGEFDVLTEGVYASREDAMGSTGQLFMPGKLEKLLRDEENFIQIDKVKVYVVEVDGSDDA